jgi:hypothetical protein
MGCLMKNGIATHSLPHEHYVLRIDGRVNSTYRRFVDALRAGLKLKDQFPHHDIKVAVKQTRNSTEEIMQGTVLH